MNMLYLEKIPALIQWLSPPKLRVPDRTVLFPVVFLLSFFVIALETLHFHVLLNVTNYLSSTAIFGIALFGIALGGLASFYLGKLDRNLTVIFSTIGTFFSIYLSYWNLYNVHAVSFPIFLILPYFFASTAISTAFSLPESQVVYFINLVGSGLGVLFPILAVSALKSEGAMVLLSFIPAVLLFLLALRVAFIPGKILTLLGAILLTMSAVDSWSLIRDFPERIAQTVWEEKILPDTGKIGDSPYVTSPAETLLKRIYKLDPDSGNYLLTVDDYDRKRLETIFDVLGFRNRFGLPFYSSWETRTVPESLESIPQDHFENEILPLAVERYRYVSGENFDLRFLNKAYTLDETTKEYVLSSEAYDRERARFLLASLGHWPMMDLNMDIRRHGNLRLGYKFHSDNQRIFLSEDSNLGRVEYSGYDDYMFMSMNGVILDGIDNFNGAPWDPRVPRPAFQKDPKIFIVGLSADGIVKSAKRVPGAQVAGIEINPTILRTMQEEGQYSRFARLPYEDVEVHAGEGRSFLEHDPRTWDLISLMNIHMEHGPVSTLSPENFHTVQGTQVLLNKLTDRGLIVYEEIIFDRRGELFFLKLLNTVRTALTEMGYTEPEKHIHIFSWDFSEGGRAFRTLSVKKTPFTESEARDMEDNVRTLIGTGWYQNVETNYNPYVRLNTVYDKWLRSPMVTSRDELPGNIVATDFIRNILSRVNDPEDAQFLLSTYTHTRYGRYYTNISNLSERSQAKLRNILDGVGYPITMDLAPVTDDQPFPFNVYENRKEAWDNFWMIFPLTLLLIVPVLLLLLRHPKNEKSEKGFLHFALPVLYASLSGFGFMLVEIVLIQKFQIFIGDPTSTVVVILGGLLVFSGAGSLVSRFLSRWVLIGVTMLIPIMLVVFMFNLDGIFQNFGGLDLGARLWLSVFLLLPLSLPMGMAFPKIIELAVKNSTPEIGALLFGISGGFSTLGSISSFVISVSYGFSTTFQIGFLVYSLALSILVILIVMNPPEKKTAS